MKYTRLEMIK